MDIEILFEELQDKKYKGSNTFELFSQFYEIEKSRVKYWLTKVFKNKGSTKSNYESDALRKEGNKFYIKGQWVESLQFYTEAISKAYDESESYSLALANRSAALYSLKEYKYALEDIKRCLLSNYPDKLKSKLYIRRISCYYKIGDRKEAENTLKESLSFIENNTIFTEQEKHLFKSKLLDIKVILSDNTITTKNCKWNMPNIVENKQFPGASSLVGLRHTVEKGRYVIAEKNINNGDILFIERAFAFAPIFNEDSKLSIGKCYYCLMNSKALIPCSYCSVCLYCNDSCRTNSWNECHQWECNGMYVNFWCSVGLAFPAFRVLLKGIPAISITDIYNVNIHESDNYRFAYNLVSNVSESKSLLEFLIVTAVVVTYLDTETSFFKWLSDQIHIQNNKDLRMLFGSLLLRHIGQIAGNASVIEHWDDSDYEYIPTKKESIAAGLYPSVSMMNHSCKSNVSLYYINDIVIVKAIEPIKQNDEVFNCYGIDYRYVCKSERKSALEIRYQFNCLCRICENPTLEIDYLNAFKCSYCTGTVFEQNQCIDCKQQADTVKIFELENNAKHCLDKDFPCLEDINKCYAIMNKIYTNFHINLAECFDSYKVYYLNQEMFNRAILYFLKSLEIRKQHWGENSMNFTKEIIQFLTDLKICRIKGGETYSEDIKNLYLKAVNILPLYFPDNFINYTELKTLIP